MLGILFILGYLAIAFEQQIRINKAASALITGVLCWTVYILNTDADTHLVLGQLETHLAEIAGILFFLLGAMVVVELIDAHDGFEIVTNQIRTTDKRRLLWLTGIITFFLSAILDNLTTTIVMVSLLRKLIGAREDRLYFAGLVVIAANAGGAFSPMGDVTTTMLWIGGQISAINIIIKLFIPSVLCLLLPLVLLSRKMKGKIAPPDAAAGEIKRASTSRERNLVFYIGIGSLVFVPVFKTVTHLPPFMAMLLGLGVMWLLTEMIHAKKDEDLREAQSVAGALQRIDTPSILFFLGILIAVSALQSQGMLAALATWLDRTIGNVSAICMSLGALSAIVDNVPLVAATQGMYALAQYPTDHYLWEFLAYTTGTGGSILVIGSAAGVAAMGMEKIDFFWYLRKIAPYALVGYLAGAAAYMLLN